MKGSRQMTTQVEQDNIALTRRGFEAFGAGDMQTLTTLIHPDANWHGPPVGIIRGEYSGRDQLLAYFKQLHEETDGTFRAIPIAMAASGNRVFVQETVSGQRRGESLESSDVLVFTIEDGKVRDVRVYTGDYPAEAKFWS
jgi:uncharacterized protein